MLAFSRKKRAGYIGVLPKIRKRFIAKMQHIGSFSSRISRVHFYEFTQGSPAGRGKTHRRFVPSHSNASDSSAHYLMGISVFMEFNAGNFAPHGGVSYGS
jgi:hypothetical protein